MSDMDAILHATIDRLGKEGDEMAKEIARLTAELAEARKPRMVEMPKRAESYIPAHLNAAANHMRGQCIKAIRAAGCVPVDQQGEEIAP